MNCKWIKRRLLAYLDGEVSPRERKLIQAHLSTCPKCQRELTAMAALQSRLRQGLAAEVGKLSVSREVWKKLDGKLERTRPVTSRELVREKLRAAVTKASLFLFGQPAWKKVVGVVLIFGVAIGLVMGVSELLQYRALALAEGIIKNDPQIQTTYGGETKVVEIKLVDGQATAVCTREGASGFVLVEVDLRAKKVLRVQPMKVTVENVGDGKLVVLPKGGDLVSLGLVVDKQNWVVTVPVEGATAQGRVTVKAGKVAATPPPLGSERVAEILESAKTDPRVQELLKRGGRITTVTETHGVQVRKGSTTEAEITALTLTGAQVVIEQDGKRWNVEITPQGEVTGITEAR